MQSLEWNLKRGQTFGRASDPDLLLGASRCETPSKSCFEFLLSCVFTQTAVLCVPHSRARGEDKARTFSTVPFLEQLSKTEKTSEPLY